MKKFLQLPLHGFSAIGFRQMFFSVLVVVALASGLWFASVPAAQARFLSPTEMIQEGLPPGKTIRNASKPEFLSAVCAAVKKHRPQAPAITKIAVSTHREYAGDIVATILRCSSSTDCEFVGTIVASAIEVAQSEASVIQDAALAIAPDCADAIQAATILDGKDSKDIPGEGPAEGPTGPISQVPLPGSIGGGGGGFNPGEQLIMVCDNGTQRTIREVRAPGTTTAHDATQLNVPESQLAAFLASHPGAFVGTCQPTPTTNP